NKEPVDMVDAKSRKRSGGPGGGRRPGSGGKKRTPNSTEGRAEDKATAQGTITYFGTYVVRESNRAIAMHVGGRSFPHWKGADQKRIVAITGDQLKLMAPIAVGTAEVVCKRAQ